MGSQLPNPEIICVIYIYRKENQLIKHTYVHGNKKQHIGQHKNQITD